MSMHDTAAQAAPSADSAELDAVLRQQRNAYERARSPSLIQRRKALRTLSRLLQDNRDAIVAALHSDFGHRSSDETRIAEIGATVANIEFARRHLAAWMRPRRRSTSMWFLPGANRVQAQPLGVVGIMAPWNYPINLAVSPLASALAAGNRAMIKMSEYTPASSQLLKQLLAQAFDQDQVAVFGGGPAESQHFSALPFDHLLFTGSTAVGRKVMAAAAANLTPLTLELGGKSPVIVASDYPMEEAASRVLWGKTTNAGQTCVAPDYVLVPQGRARDFVIWMSRHYRQRFPDGAQGQDYSSIIDQRNYQRLGQLVETAQSGGAEVVPLEPHTEALVAARKFPLTLILNPADDSRVMREEIFGPVLPVLEVPDVDHAVQRINAGERPLALYLFSHSEKIQQTVMKNTHAGGVTINDVMLQYLQVAQPFGGVGASGFGRYHGREGFETFSHMKAVFVQRGFGRFTGLKLLYPPYGPLSRRLISLMGG